MRKMGTLHIKLVFVEKYTLTNFLAVLDHSKTIMCCHLLPNFKSIKIKISNKFQNIIWRWVQISQTIVAGGEILFQNY